MLPNLRQFIKRQKSDASSDNEWYNEWQRVTTSDNQWQRVVQRVVRWVTTNENECQRITMSGYFGQFTFFREDSTNRHSKENPLNLWTLTYWIKSRLGKSSSLEEILTLTHTNLKICKNCMTWTLFLLSAPAILISICMRFAMNTYLGETTSNFK